MGLLALPQQFRAKYGGGLAINENWQDWCELMAPERGAQGNGNQTSTGATKEGLDEIETRPENQCYSITWPELGLQMAGDNITCS